MRRALTAAVALLVPATAVAEINVADSVEWMVADSDLVVRARVVAVTSRRGPGQVRYERATLQVSETFKGPASTGFEIVTRDLGAAERPSRWRATNADLILFLVDSKRRAADDPELAKAAFALRRGSHDGAFIRLDSPGRVAFPMNQKALTARADIVSAVRAAGRFRGASKASPFRFDLPGNSPAFRRLWAGSAVWLMLPIDSRLEAMGRSLIRSKQLGDRAEGARALAHFKKPSNAVLLERLLADPGSHIETRAGGQRTRVFPVREIALDALRRWGRARNRAPTVRVPLP